MMPTPRGTGWSWLLRALGMSMIERRNSCRMTQGVKPRLDSTAPMKAKTGASSILGVGSMTSLVKSRFNDQVSG
jgi:hypothetical protein